jgi:hypothetical protein
MRLERRENIGPGDYVTWRDGDGNPRVGRVVLVRENDLGRRFERMMGIRFEAGPIALVDAGENLQLLVDLNRSLRRVWVH